jgi:hypothetical protein
LSPDESIAFEVSGGLGLDGHGSSEFGCLSSNYHSIYYFHTYIDPSLDNDPYYTHLIIVENTNPDLINQKSYICEYENDDLY